jgi:hypothetical protein
MTDEKESSVSPMNAYLDRESGEQIAQSGFSPSSLPFL